MDRLVPIISTACWLAKCVSAIDLPKNSGFRRGYRQRSLYVPLSTRLTILYEIRCGHTDTDKWNGISEIFGGKMNRIARCRVTEKNISVFMAACDVRSFCFLAQFGLVFGISTAVNSRILHEK